MGHLSVQAATIRVHPARFTRDGSITSASRGISFISFYRQHPLPSDSPGSCQTFDVS